MRKEFRVALKDKQLQDLKQMTHSLLEISFSIPPGGEAYFDDVKIVERASSLPDLESSRNLEHEKSPKR